VHFVIIVDLIIRVQVQGGGKAGSRSPRGPASLTDRISAFVMMMRALRVLLSLSPLRGAVADCNVHSSNIFLDNMHEPPPMTGIEDWGACCHECNEGGKGHPNQGKCVHACYNTHTKECWLREFTGGMFRSAPGMLCGYSECKVCDQACCAPEPGGDPIVKPNDDEAACHSGESVADHAGAPCTTKTVCCIRKSLFSFLEGDLGCVFPTTPSSTTNADEGTCETQDDILHRTTWGWVFTGLLTGLGVAYLMVGTSYGRCAQGRCGSAALPNRPFWANLSGLVTDGLGFVVRRGGGPRDESSPLLASGAPPDNRQSQEQRRVPGMPGWQASAGVVPSAVHRAIAAGDKSGLQLALQAAKGKPAGGGAVDDGDPKRWTAFHVACANGDAQFVALLLDAKCNVGLRNQEGLTGWELASQLGHWQVLALQ
jgi:hypothetical protein